MWLPRLPQAPRVSGLSRSDLVLWIVEDCDWVSALRYCRDGRLTLKGWRRSLQGINETSYFAKDDLWPVAGAVAADVRGLVNYWRLAKRPGGPYLDVGPKARTTA